MPTLPGCSRNNFAHFAVSSLQMTRDPWSTMICCGGSRIKAEPFLESTVICSTFHLSHACVIQKNF